MDLLKKENINYNNKERKIKLNKNISFYFNVVQIPKKTKLINKKNIVKNLIKYYIKKYDYILIDIGKDSDEFVKEEILKNSDKRIIVGNNNLLKIKEVRKLAKNNKEIEKYIASEASPYEAAAKGYVDIIIDPLELRPRLIYSYDMLSTKRTKNIAKKHDNI